jgi:hypothetical protein
VEISFNSDILKAGKGIFLDRRTQNRILIDNINQGYNISSSSVTNLSTNNTIPLSNFNNYVRHENGGVPIVLIRDLEIFIDDSTINWKKGQTLRLVFQDPLNLDIFDVKIKTDALNKTNSGAYGVLISILNDLDFSSSDGSPIFDIICINETSLEFKIDKIR